MTTTASPPLHNAAARGDRELIEYLVGRGADVTVLTRKGETTADMANGPVQRVTVFPEIVALLERLGLEEQRQLRVLLTDRRFFQEDGCPKKP